MKVLVFGTADETSRAVVAEALDAGHEVTAVFPAGTDVGLDHDRLEVLDGDVTDQSFVDKAVLGKDAVVSTVGVTTRRPTTLHSEATANIVEAVRGTEPRRVVCVSSSHVDADGPGLSPLRRLYTKLIIHRRYRNTLNDMTRMENELLRSGLDWTVVRPTPLRPGRSTGRYRVAVDGHVPGGRPLPTGDLGRYVATHLDDPTTYGTVVEVAA
jgi:putative NADH-flavin reductase